MDIIAGGARDYETPVDDVVFEVIIWKRQEGRGAGYWVEADYALTGCDVHAAIAFARRETPQDGQYELHVCYREAASGNGMQVWLAGSMPEELRGDGVRYRRYT